MQVENYEKLPLEKYTIEATEQDMLAIDILFGSSVPAGLEKAGNDQVKVTRHTIDGLFGASNGIMRSALLLKYVAGNKPEIFISLLAIADAISSVGESLANRFEEDEKASLNVEELQPIIDILSQIHIDLPEELQAFKKATNVTEA